MKYVESPDIHECFRGLTGSQRTPGIWGVTRALLQMVTFQQKFHICIGAVKFLAPLMGSLPSVLILIIAHLNFTLNFSLYLIFLIVVL